MLRLHHLLELSLPGPSVRGRQNPGGARQASQDDRNPLAPVMGHFNLLGEYDFSNDKLQDNTGVLPSKSVAKVIPEYWERPTR